MVPPAHVLSKDWKLWQIDKKNDLLYGKLDRKIYIDQPKIFENRVGVISRYMQSPKNPHIWMRFNRSYDMSKDITIPEDQAPSMCSSSVWK